MALLDLSLVTDAMIRLLAFQLPEYGVLPAVTLNISPAPPDLVKGDFALSYYLYHVREEAHTKGQDWGTDAGVPQRFKPMGVALYYVLSARSTIADLKNRTYADQQMMGLAIKTLHDYPILNDSSAVPTGGGPQVVFPAGLLGFDNRLHLHLHPIPYNEAAQYWQAGSQPLRLAAYYEVSATLLEPEQLTSRATRVLTVGVHAFVRGTPRIDSSQNTVTFVPPDDPTPRTITFSPAEVTYGDRFELHGANLKGDRTTLVLNTRRFPNEITIDPTAWKVTTDGSTLSAEVQTMAGAQPVFPGVYTATVVTSNRKRLPDGRSRDFDWVSNAAAFSIVPRISAVTVSGTGIFRLTFPDFDLTLLDPNAEIQFFVGTTKLTVIGGAPTAGRFQVQDATHLRFRCPAGSVTGDALPVRVIVLGAENAPLWINVP
jgi:Pvc16 N-terminal domain